MNTNVIKCPICGEINNKKIDDNTFKCNICSAHFTIMASEINHLLEEALTYRDMYDFKTADERYQKIIDECDDDKVKVMCYFGRLLCYFGVKYIKDFNGNTILTISKFLPEDENIKKTTYYKMIEKSSYFENYKDKLEDLQKEIQRINEELNQNNIYDVFLCTKISLKTKNSPDAEGRTEDSQIASKLYNELKNKGLNVFYSDEVLAGIDYDAQIYTALMRSRLILVISSKKEYLESTWVQSEWRRWINFINVGLKEKNSLYLYIPSGKQYELPLILEKVQIFNDTLTVSQKITNHVNSEIDRENIILDNNTKIKKSVDEELWIMGKECLKSKDYENAYYYFYKSAEMGNPKAQNDLGLLYKYGKGVEKSLKKSVEYFKKAADQEYEDAQYNLGLAYESGLGVAIDSEAAANYYYKAGVVGHSNARYQYAICLLHGVGRKKNKRRALAWLDKASQIGNEKANAEILRIREADKDFIFCLLFILGCILFIGGIIAICIIF